MQLFTISNNESILQDQTVLIFITVRPTWHGSCCSRIQERMGHDDDLHIVLARETDESRLASCWTSCRPSFRVLPETTVFLSN